MTSKSEGLGVLLFFICFIGLFDYAKSIERGGLKLKSMTGTHKTCTGDGMVALSFDDGLQEETEQILDILHKHRIQATFFIIGSTIRDYPNSHSVLRRILNDGHTLGSHSFNHYDMGVMGADQIRSELVQTENAFVGATGKKPKYFRPPFGSMNWEVSKVAEEMGYEVVNWNVETNDWRYDYDYTPILHAISAAETGYRQSKIVLMHDRPLTVKSLDHIIKYYKDLGYKFVNMQKCLNGGHRSRHHYRPADEYISKHQDPTVESEEKDYEYYYNRIKNNMKNNKPIW